MENMLACLILIFTPSAVSFLKDTMAKKIESSSVDEHTCNLKSLWYSNK